MTLETRVVPRREIPTRPATAARHRVRNEVWHLKEQAERRRRRANAVMLGSLLAVLVLLRVFYVLLTK
jgi:hypothetical protein